MNSFLDNLINRHQEFSDHREVSYKVEPRPKSIFETEIGASTALDNSASTDYMTEQSSEPDLGTGSQTTQRHLAVEETLANDKISASLKTYEIPVNKSMNPIDRLIL